MPLRVYFLGPRGTFTHQAAIQEYGAGDDIQYVEVQNLADIPKSLTGEEAEVGVIPYENSTNGHVVPTLDLLRDLDTIQVTGEIDLHVHQCLLSHNARLSDIKRIYSHPQAFGQCETFLGKELHGTERVNVSSTGRAAILASQDRESAAIASSLSASESKISILKPNIEDNHSNTTRFLVLSYQRVEGHIPPIGEPVKTLIRFTVPHGETGALSRVLQWFAEANVNITSMFTRPKPQAVWEYVFFVEINGLKEDIVEIRSKIERTGEQVRILGSWRVASTLS